MVMVGLPVEQGQSSMNCLLQYRIANADEQGDQSPCMKGGSRLLKQALHGHHMGHPRRP